MNFIVFNTSGEIIRTGYCPESVIPNQALLNETAIAGEATSATQYIPDIAIPVITDRPANPATIDKLTVIADNSDYIELTGVPIGSQITAGTQTEIATDSTIHITFDIVAETKITIDLFPYLPTTFSVQAI